MFGVLVYVRIDGLEVGSAHAPTPVAPGDLIALEDRAVRVVRVVSQTDSEVCVVDASLVRFSVVAA